ncbi:hypothetical protein V2W45_430306 [Cenococcum geophilum]
MDGIARPGLNGLVVPDDGDTPFQMLATGIQIATPELASIVAMNTTTGPAIPYGATYSGKSTIKM